MSTAPEKIRDWSGALIFALLVNLVLFLIMPALIAVHPEKKELEDLGQAVTLTKVRQEQKKENKKDKPPEPPKEKPKPLKPTQMNAVVQKPKLSMPFKLNQRLPAMAGGLSLPPIDCSLPMADMSGVFSVGDIDGQLMPLVQIQPLYPHRARRRNIEGWVKLQFIINEEGLVENMQVLESKPEGVFDNVVRKAVSRWKFKPATIGGNKVKIRTEQIFRFDLD